MNDLPPRKSRDQIEKELDDSIQKYLKKRRKRIFLFIFGVLESILSAFVLFDMFWGIYLARRGGTESLINALYFIFVFLTLFILLIGLVFYLIDRKYNFTGYFTEGKNFSYKELSKNQKISVILIIGGMVLSMLFLILEHSLLLLYGLSIITIIFRVLEWIGFGMVVIGFLIILR